MRQDARMLAALFERSMGLGEAWEVSGTWFEEVEGGPDEPRAGVARRRGHAVPCPECGVPCGARDARERTWRHLDIWQFRTYVHCAVPRTDCPEHGAGTVPVPWEVRPNSHLAALFEAQVLAARVRGSTVKAVAEALVGGDRRPRDMLGRAVAQARGSADYSGAGRVGHRRDRPPATCRALLPWRPRKDAAGDAARRPLPSHAALSGGDRSRRVPRAQGVFWFNKNCAEIALIFEQRTHRFLRSIRIA